MSFSHENSTENDWANRIRAKNSHLNWISTSEFEQQHLGKQLHGHDTSNTLHILKSETLPERVAYVASNSALEACSTTKVFQNEVYGELPIQVGHCIGHNRRLNALEFHLGSEVLIAASDLVLLLDFASEIKNNSYNPHTLKALYVKEGDVLEIFPRVLHFAPIEISEAGFRAAIILPQGTNLPLEANVASRTQETPKTSPTPEANHTAPLQSLLFARNKWLIAHPESPSAQRGAVAGISGVNIELILL